MDEGPSASVAQRVARLAEGQPLAWERIWGGGYTPAERWVVSFDDGTSAFVKVGVTELTAGWLRDEHRVYRQLRARFLPQMLGWEDDAQNPILLLEDLSQGHWPPPWDEQQVHRVLDALEIVRSVRPPDGLPTLESQRERMAGWAHVAGEPDSFLALGVCSRRWLERSLSTLVDADRTAVLAGDELLHLDVRSDNICFAGDRTLLVDWNQACVGNAVLDLVGWMPSLFLEWGAQAQAFAPNEPELAGLIAGYFAHKARLPAIPDAPRVRGAQLDALKVSLPWAARLLGLPPPDGPALLKGR